MPWKRLGPAVELPGGDATIFRLNLGAASPMEKSLPTQLVNQVSGSFERTALLQKRVRELVRGQKPLFETRERNFIKIASEELSRGLIELVPDEEERPPPII